MNIIGLTGGIGMGKSVAADLLRRKEIRVIDTDVIARELVAPGQAALRDIEHVFGKSFIDGNGRLCRALLAQRVFAEPEARRQLEAILHPRIRNVWITQTLKLRAEGTRLCVVVIPLLFETKAQKELSATVCVACSPETQRQRLLARGWSPEQIRQRCEAQWPPEQKAAAADFVIWNEAGFEVLEAQLDRVLAQVTPSPVPTPQPR